MLSRIITRPFSLLLKRSASFSAGHDHDHHDHHDYHVSVDKTATWIKYKTNPKLMCIEGVEDTHYQLQPLDDSDPFEHIRNSPFFSFDRMVFTDPWYHDDSHEPYNSAPERGYINGQDPLESRFLYTVPLFVVISIVGITGTLLGFADLEIGSSEAFIHNEKAARDYVVDSLKEKNRILNALRAREAELLQSTSE